MAQMVLDCPHCTSERTGFGYVGEQLEPRSQLVWNTFWVCLKCREGVVVKLLRRDTGVSPHQCIGDPTDEGYDLIRIHPTPQSPSIPEHVPEDIASDFGEAMDNIRRQNWVSAGMMLRKVLQRTTTALASDNGLDLQKTNLWNRIAKLAEERCITPAMREWADIIRDDGNEATHEEEQVFSREQAEQMAEFTEVFLLYAFTLPGRVKEHKEKASPQLESP